MKKFQRKIEDFTCDQCGSWIQGDGYTNHCPNCLHSKHVDIFPGDRKNKCGGLMEPVSAFFSGGQWTIIHQCRRCNEQRRIKFGEKDSLATLQLLLESLSR